MPYTPPEDNLRYTIEAFDEGDNFIECLGRLHDLDAALAAFWACCTKYPDNRLFLRDRARVIKRYDVAKV